MTAKEKIRFSATIVLSGIFAFLAVLLLDAVVAEIFMMPSKMTETFYGFVLFAWVMASIALFMIGVGTLSVGALGAFFAFSFWKYPKTWIRRGMKCIFILDVVFLGTSLFAILILLL